MSMKRKIRAKDVVADIRAGVTDDQLMEKYQLSLSDLKGIYQKLVDSQALHEIELEGRGIDAPASSADSSAPTGAARSYVMFKLPVYDLDDMTVEGLVYDISETDLVVEGISAQVGDVKSLLIQADEFADVYPFSFDAVCSGIEDGSSSGGPALTFEITSISQVGRAELRKLRRFLGLSS